jgi:hypothetical protein
VKDDVDDEAGQVAALVHTPHLGEVAGQEYGGQR